MNNELAVRTSVEAEITGFEMKPRTLKEAMDFCDLMANSDLVPKDYRGKPGNIMVAIQMGSELGMTPMRALRSIAVINGRASQWGDDMLAMVLASPVCEYVHEDECTEECGVCEGKRKDDPKPHRVTFSLADAKRAGLLGKQGPWQTNTKRMLQLRARGFCLRDKFPDVLAGLVSVEEALDLPRVEPDDPATNILEAAQPLTLKDKLKAKVETATPSSILAASEAKEARPVDGAGQADSPVTTQQASDAPAPFRGIIVEPAQRLADALNDDPAAPYRAKIVTAHDEKECQAAYNATPETLKQDVHGDYFDTLKRLSKAKPLKGKP